MKIFLFSFVIFNFSIFFFQFFMLVLFPFYDVFVVPFYVVSSFLCSSIVAVISHFYFIFFLKKKVKFLSMAT
jgi:hypothetical protein